MKRIEDVEHPEVGRFYLVPCVQRGVEASSYPDRWWPVIGPWHEDADIKTPAYHFHHDVRFFPDKWLKRTNEPGWDLGRIAVPVGFANSTTPPPVIYKRRKMWRQMPDFPCRNYSDNSRPDLIVILEGKFREVRMKCMTCPHRGMSLSGLPVKPDGTVVCNGHGLRWNVKTGEMVKRDYLAEQNLKSKL